MPKPEPELWGLPRLSVLIAEECAASNLPLLLDILRPGEHPEVEFLLCSVAAPAQVRQLGSWPNLLGVASVAGARIPHMWRDGILAARGARVALTTAHCLPSPDWLARMLQTPLDGQRVAVGGAIRNAPASAALGRAIYALRYGDFTPLRPSAVSDELAADNALYRRADLLAHPELLRLGFWEPSFHARFREAGLHLYFDAQLVVEHHNLYAARAFGAQRFAHGIEFGRARGAAWGRGKLLMILLLAPLLPLVFLRKLLLRAAGNGEIKLSFGVDFLWLICFVCAWCFGEVLGYLSALVSRQPTAPASEHSHAK